MDLIVAGRDVVVDFDPFISTQPMAEQAQVPTRKITAMIYPAAQKPEPAVTKKTIDVSAADRLAYFAFPVRRDAVVSMHHQHPFHLPANHYHIPVPFSPALPHTQQ